MQLNVHINNHPPHIRSTNFYLWHYSPYASHIQTYVGQTLVPLNVHINNHPPHTSTPPIAAYVIAFHMQVHQKDIFQRLMRLIHFQSYKKKLTIIPPFDLIYLSSIIQKVYTWLNKLPWSFTTNVSIPSSFKGGILYFIIFKFIARVFKRGLIFPRNLTILGGFTAKLKGTIKSIGHQPCKHNKHK